MQNPVEIITKVNEFLGTNRSPELIQQIADATSFSKMKEGKKESMDSMNTHLNKVSFSSVSIIPLYRFILNRSCVLLRVVFS